MARLARIVILGITHHVTHLCHFQPPRKNLFPTTPALCSNQAYDAAIAQRRQPRSCGPDMGLIRAVMRDDPAPQRPC